MNLEEYGNQDCQASEGFAKHVAEGDANGCCCEQIFSMKKGPQRPYTMTPYGFEFGIYYFILINSNNCI